MANKIETSSKNIKSRINLNYNIDIVIYYFLISWKLRVAVF